MSYRRPYAHESRELFGRSSGASLLRRLAHSGTGSRRELGGSLAFMTRLLTALTSQPKG